MGKEKHGFEIKSFNCHQKARRATAFWEGRAEIPSLSPDPDEGIQPIPSTDSAQGSGMASSALCASQCWEKKNKAGSGWFGSWGTWHLGLGKLARILNYGKQLKRAELSPAQPALRSETRHWLGVRNCFKEKSRSSLKRCHKWFAVNNYA